MALKTAYILRRPVVEIKFGRVCCAWADLWKHTVAVVCEFGRVEANRRVLLGLLALTNAVARWPSVKQRALSGCYVHVQRMGGDEVGVLQGRRRAKH
jgi:hypothetical protein